MIYAYILFGLSALSALLLWAACVVSGRADDADDYAELAAFWPDMQGLPEGDDIFLSKNGPPSGQKDQ